MRRTSSWLSGSRCGPGNLYLICLIICGSKRLSGCWPQERRQGLHRLRRLCSPKRIQEPISGGQIVAYEGVVMPHPFHGIGVITGHAGAKNYRPSLQDSHRRINRLPPRIRALLLLVFPSPPHRSTSWRPDAPAVPVYDLSLHTLTSLLFSTPEQVVRFLRMQELGFS